MPREHGRLGRGRRGLVVLHGGGAGPGAAPTLASRPAPGQARAPAAARAGAGAGAGAGAVRGRARGWRRLGRERDVAGGRGRHLLEAVRRRGGPRRGRETGTARLTTTLASWAVAAGGHEHGPSRHRTARRGLVQPDRDGRASDLHDGGRLDRLEPQGSFLAAGGEQVPGQEQQAGHDGACECSCRYMRPNPPHAFPRSGRQRLVYKTVSARRAEDLRTNGKLQAQTSDVVCAVGAVAAGGRVLRLRLADSPQRDRSRRRSTRGWAPRGRLRVRGAAGRCDGPGPAARGGAGAAAGAAAPQLALRCAKFAAGHPAARFSFGAGGPGSVSVADRRACARLGRRCRSRSTPGSCGALDAGLSPSTALVAVRSGRIVAGVGRGGPLTALEPGRAARVRVAGSDYRGLQTAPLSRPAGARLRGARCLRARSTRQAARPKGSSSPPCWRR